MVAILLYLIGLISVLVTVLLVAAGAPAMWTTLQSAYGAGTQPLLSALASLATSHGWALVPFLGGLLLMGFARIIMLLGGIQRALKGPA